MEKHVVLIALSQASVGAALEARLMKAGHEVMRAYAADQIEAVLPKKVFTMVVLDLAWLGVGFPLVRRMREGRFTSRLPIAVVAEKQEQISFAMHEYGVLPVGYSELDAMDFSTLLREAQLKAQKQTKTMHASTMGG